jgi:hypothetical protein
MLERWLAELEEMVISRAKRRPWTPWGRRRLVDRVWRAALTPRREPHRSLRQRIGDDPVALVGDARAGLADTLRRALERDADRFRAFLDDPIEVDTGKLESLCAGLEEAADTVAEQGVEAVMDLGIAVPADSDLHHEAEPPPVAQPEVQEPATRADRGPGEPGDA